MSNTLKLKKTSLDRLFYNPLFRYKVVDHAVFDASLMMEGERLRAESDGVRKSNRLGWHSKGNIFSDNAPSFKELHRLATEMVHEATAEVAPKFELKDRKLKLFGWMNHNPPGGYNAPHTHPGAHWSGVYYVNQPPVPEGSSGGTIEFMDPRSDLPHWRKFKSPAFKHKFQIRPEAGELVLFPSYLLHWVYPNEAEDSRVTIAFNATFPD